MLDRLMRRLEHADAFTSVSDRLRVLRGRLIKGRRIPLSASAGSVGGDQFGILAYACNICGTANKRRMALLQREEPSCDGCGSTLRNRGVIHALSTSLFDDNLMISEFPHRADIVGWGMTDWDGYASRLAQRLSYTNTYYHKEPFLDITSVSDSNMATLDFLISSDVLEHVGPPVIRALENSRKLLKPDGALILTVPYGLQAETIEHYPNLHDFAIVGEGEGRRVVNITADGTQEIHSSPVFHGGEGSTLEMRVFSETGLLADLKTAGFSRVTICAEPCFEHGIYWWYPWSLPIVARP